MIESVLLTISISWFSIGIIYHLLKRLKPARLTEHELVKEIREMTFPPMPLPDLEYPSQGIRNAEHKKNVEPYLKRLNEMYYLGQLQSSAWPSDWQLARGYYLASASQEQILEMLKEKYSIDNEREF